MLNKFLGTLTLVFLLSSCANYKIHYSPEEQNWVKNMDPPQTEPTHVIYLIGDAGNSSEGEVAPALQSAAHQTGKRPGRELGDLSGR
jgi:hypothetical protein